MHVNLFKSIIFVGWESFDCADLKIRGEQRQIRPSFLEITFSFLTNVEPKQPKRKKRKHKDREQER